MQIELRLFATLRDHLPEQSDGKQIKLELPDGTSIAGVLEQFDVPLPLAHLVLVNGVYVRDLHSRLQPGDVLSVFPPVAGGGRKPRKCRIARCAPSYSGDSSVDS